MEIVNGTGRRKTSIARVYLKSGKGSIEVNGQKLEKVFPSMILQSIIKEPLQAVDGASSYDIKVNIKGGGIKGQAEAFRLGISRALVVLNPEFRESLKKEGLLRRDPRMVERKKYGRRKARRKFQFSKR